MGFWGILDGMAIPVGKREFDNLLRLLEPAKAEDLGGGDVTGELLPVGLHARARFVAREELVFCGGVFLPAVAAAYDSGIATELSVADGQCVPAGTPLACWSGQARAMFAAERVALNFLQRLCGIATITAQYVRAVAGTEAAILDTRKTTPGWRELEKYAVRCGGGTNHRRGLYDAVLVKDNHLAALAAAGEGRPIQAIGRRLAEARPRLGPDGFVEIEVDTLAQLADVLELRVDIVLLDNMAPADLRRAVAMRNAAGLRGRVALEASGGVTLETVRRIAEAGVERISVGALTHSVRAVDIGLDVEFA